MVSGAEHCVTNRPWNNVLYRKDATRHYNPGRECLMYPFLNMSKRVGVASALWSRSDLF